MKRAIHATALGLAALVAAAGCSELIDEDDGSVVVIQENSGADAGSSGEAPTNGDRDAAGHSSDERESKRDAYESGNDATVSGPYSDTFEPSLDVDAGDDASEPRRDAGNDECPGGGARCDGVCVDLSSSDDHCSSCGNACPSGATCEESSCTCAGGETLCNDQCVDTDSNSDNCGACGKSCATGEICSSGICAPSTEVADVIAETNDVRSTDTDCGEYGVRSSAPPLQGNTNLHQAAQGHAEDMMIEEFVGHTGSDGSTFDERIRDAGFAGQPVAENVAAGNSTAAATVQQWEDSDGHCKNMMLDRANRIGVGFAQGGPYGYYWVQVFGRK